MVTFDNLEQYFHLVKRHGPARGYYPDTTKSIMTVHPNNIKAGKLFGRCHGFKVCTGACYLSVYIGDEKSKGSWLKTRKEKWERDIWSLSKTAEKYPQDNYAAANRTVQSEWIFLQRVKKDTGHAFAWMEKFLQETFLPCLFLGKPKTLPPVVGSLSMFMVKKTRLFLQNTVTSAKEK